MIAMRGDTGYVLSVTQLNEYVNGLLRRDVLLQGLQVRGEVSGFKRHSSGHLYFSIKDAGALVRCVMFRQNAVSLSALPKDGEQVTVSGSVSLYVKDGQYQFYVTRLQREGRGDLYRRFLESKEALEAEGLFAQEHKQKLPLLPRCLGVITSPTGAAIQDILHIARRRFPGMDILLYPVRVQGEGAAEEIAQGIRDMDRLGRADVLIIGRGGGSLEDLWAFNEECVARAIYACKIPTVSAVGHETDFSIADFVADLRAPTPSAAAELCVPEYARLKGEILGAEQSIRASAHNRLLGLKQELDALAASGAFSLPKHRIDLLRGEVERLQTFMQGCAKGELLGAYGSLEGLCARLEEMNPRRVLQRGYAMVKLPQGYAGSARDLHQGAHAQLVLQDGQADILIERVEETGEYGSSKEERTHV